MVKTENSKESVSQFFDQFNDYGVYYRSSWKYYRMRYVRKIDKYFNNQKDIKILDLGCGRMCSLQYLLDREYVTSYTCVDASKESLQELNLLLGKDPKVAIQEGDVVDYLRNCSQKFDIIIFFGVLMYLPREECLEVMRYADKCLSNRGMLIIHEPNESSWRHLDPHATFLDKEFREKLFSQIENKSELFVRHYNIAILRRAICIPFHGLAKLLSKLGLYPVGIRKILHSCESILLWLESKVEALFSKTLWGMDSMIVIERTKGKNVKQKLLDLGCGVKKRAGALGVDIIEVDGVDVVHDLNDYPYPFQENEFDDILMDNSLEHLDSVILTLEEVWRIAKPNAKLVIKVPYFRSHNAIDPTHKHFFAYHSLNYFDKDEEFNNLYRYSDKCSFKIERIAFEEEYIEYSWISKIYFWLPRFIANKNPEWYETYFAHLMPLHSISYYLKVVK